MTSSSKKPPGGGDGGYLGRILDERYRLDQVIGAGAIGKVYAGTQLAVDRKVAIKLLHPAIRDRELGKERFLREAKAVARLSHSSCLTLFDFGSDDELGCFYMVTEFVQGTTLASKMQQDELDVDRRYHVLYQATTALQHAHERGILHRDLKPENIMLVAEDGMFSSVKVLDFGLARIREEAAQDLPSTYLPDPDESSGQEGSDPVDAGHTKAGQANAGQFNESRLTNFGELNGTPAYMSPEQCRGDLNLTPACDYYSLGVLAYELLEGRLPYESSVVQRLLLMHLNDPIPQMTSEETPQPIEEMIYRLLAKNPTHRLQSADEILETLRPYIAFDPSRELSRATLERYRRETPPKAQPQASEAAKPTPVAESGAETLENYSDVNTPVPMASTAVAGESDADGLSRDSAFGTMLAADKSAEATGEASEESLAHILPMLAVVLFVFAAAGTWWFLRTPVSEPASSEASSVASSVASEAEHASDTPDEEASLTGIAEPEDEKPGDTEVPAPSEEQSGAPAVEASEVEKTKPKSRAAPKAEKAEKAEEAKQRQRPRKLELTY